MTVPLAPVDLQALALWQSRVFSHASNALAIDDIETTTYVMWVVTNVALKVSGSR
jgi:hypothetical protein